MPDPYGAPYNPNENFQLTEPYSSGPGPANGGLSLFPEYQPQPSYPSYPSYPDQSPGQPAPQEQAPFQSAFGPTPDQWTTTPGTGGAPTQYRTDQPFVMYMDGGAPPSQPAAGAGAGAGPNADPTWAPMGQMSRSEQLNASLTANQNEGDYAQRKALIEAGQKYNALDLEQAKQGAQEDTKKFYEEPIRQAVELSKQRTAEMVNWKPTTLFGDSNGGKREATLLTMVLGATADAVSGRTGMPTAVSALTAAMQQKKEEDAARAEALVLRSRAADASRDELIKARDQALTDVEHKAAARWKVLQMQADADIAAMAPGQQRDQAVKNAVTINKLAEKQEQDAQQAAANLTAKEVSTQIQQRKLRGGGGAGNGADGGQMDIRTVLDWDGNPVGRAPGTGKVSTEGVAARKMFAGTQPLREGLKQLRDEVNATGTMDRVPLLGQFTDNQEKIQGTIGTLNAPISQVLGSGTPQEQEAKRMIKNLSVSFGQGPDVALSNIDTLEKYVRDAYNSRVRSLVPSYAPPTAGGGQAVGGRQLNNQDQAALQWANSNPNDPRAAQIKSRLGM